MKRVVVVSTVFPFPVDNGKKVVLAGLVRYLLELYGADKLHYVVVGSNPQAAGGIQHIHSLRKPGPLVQIRNTTWQSFVMRRKSIQEAMLFSATLQDELHRLVEDLDPELVVLDTVRIGQFFETHDRPDRRYVLYMDDLFSVRYSRMLQVLDQFPHARLNPLGNFRSMIPGSLQPLAELPWVQRFLLRHEQERIAARERQCVSWFEHSLLISPDEVQRLRQVAHNDRIRPLPPLLPPPHESLRSFCGDPTFVFLGVLNVPHNEYSLTHFLETQMRSVLSLMPNARLRVIGKGARPELHRLARSFGDAVSIEGYVDDLGAVFREACAMIIPLVFGSGVKLKTLEALSFGLPVVSTSFGVEGITARVDNGCLVTDDLSEFPGLLKQLCAIPANERTSAQARRFYQENYSVSVVTDMYDELFNPNVGD